MNRLNPAARHPRLRFPRWDVRTLAPVLALWLGWIAVSSPVLLEAAWTPLELPARDGDPLADEWPGSPWARVPRGRQDFGGVTFHVDTRVRLTGLDDARAGRSGPAEILGLAVNSTPDAVAVLHALEGAERDGTPVVALVFHFADGLARTVRLGAGVHVRASVGERAGGTEARLPDSGSTRVWPAEGVEPRGGVRLYATRIPNPRPGVRIATLDILSLYGHATPCIAGLSIDGGTEAAAVRPGTGRGRAVRRLESSDLAALRRPLRVIATEGAGGRPVTNAEAFLSLGPAGERFLLGHARADAAGEMVLTFPPSQAVEYTVLVRAPGRQVAVVTRSRNRRESLEADLTVSLAAGVPVGGVVQDDAGKPVAGARVVVFREQSERRRSWLRIEADEVLADAAGRWSSAATGDDLADWRFEIRAPRHAGVVYKVGDPASGTRVWGVSELRQRTARATLSPMPGFHLIVVNGSGNPVGGAQVFSMADDATRPRLMGRTDSNGRWESSAEETAAGMRVGVLAEGYAPGMVGFDPDATGAEVRLVLARLATLVGLVQDQGGDPVPGVEVRVQGWNDTDLLGFSAVTDARGRFTLTNAAPGTINLRLQRTGFYPANYSMAWEQGELSLTLQRQTMVFGRVVDSVTGKPIPEFIIIRGRAYNPGENLSWERYNPVRGRNGAFSTRLDLYSNQGRSALIVEAPGYLPVASPEWSKPGWYTNEFRLTPGNGIGGTVLLPDGSPAVGAALVLVDPGSSAFLERPGQLNRSGASGDTIRADRLGRFQFAPRLKPWRLVAVHDAGFADVPAADVEKGGRVTLVPWGRVEGVFKVGERVEPTQMVRLDRFNTPYYGSEGVRDSAVAMQFKTVPGPDGRFVFDKVPPGLQRVSVEYKFVERRNGGPVAISHGLPVDVKPGDTARVTLGGGGRRVTGHVRLLGGDPDQVNWLNDVHEMQLVQPVPPGQPTFTLTPNDDGEARQRKQVEYQRALAQYYATPAGREFLRAARSYVCVFDTNGTFHIDNVPPGQYSLRIAPHEPPQQGDYYNYNELGSLYHTLIVPSGGAENAVLDIGTLDLRIRGQMRPGRPVPDFEIQTVEGKTLRSTDLKGRVVVLYFFATWASDAGDQKVLRSIAEATPAEGAPKVEVLLLSVDQDKQALAEYLKTQKPPGTVCPLGDASQSPLVTALGIDGYPTAMVVDVQGRVGAFNLRGASISRAVKQLSAAAQRAAATR